MQSPPKKSALKEIDDKIQSIQVNIDSLRDKLSKVTETFKLQGENKGVDLEKLSKDKQKLAEYRSCNYSLTRCETELAQLEKQREQEVKAGLERLEKHREEVKQAKTINYVWIGPPAKVPGQDTGGPLKMANLNKENPIVF